MSWDKKELMFLLIPLVLTGITHFWNVGFPPLHPDEGHYLRRALAVSNGFGVYEKSGAYAAAYDHPFFGQILIGSIFALSGYPNSVISTPETLSSVEMSIAFPRVIMGIFALVDTFLVFKISRRAYNSQVALFSSVLFAVTPMTWLLRRITLDSIGLPFLLTSVLISLNLVTWNNKGNFKNHVFLGLLSGICLGLAILTKIPFFTMMPLVGYLIYKYSSHLKKTLRLSMVLIWIAPILLISFLWPLYSIYSDEFDLWKKGVADQSTRGRREIIESFFNIDMVLLILGLAGLIYSFVKKEWILLLWIIPFLMFAYIHGWFSSFHWIIVFPAFCIAGAKFVIELFQKVKFDKLKVSHSLIVICTIISAMGMFVTFSLINQDLTSHAIRGIAEALDYADLADGHKDGEFNENITVITGTPYSWIFKYNYKLNYTLDSHRDLGQQKIETEKVLVLQDRGIASRLDQMQNQYPSELQIGPLNENTSVFFDDDHRTRWFNDYGGWVVLDVGAAKNICNLEIAWYKGDLGRRYNYIVTTSNTDKSLNNILLRANSSGTDVQPETIDMNDTSTRYLNVTVFGNTDNTIGSISEIRINGKEEFGDECKKIPVRNMFFSGGASFKTSGDYDIVVSYQKALNNTKKISEYRTETDDLNNIAELFTTRKYSSPTKLELETNY